MNLLPPLLSTKTSESFVDSPSNSSTVSSKIRAVLDPMIGSNDLCSLYSTIREIGVKNEKASSQVSDSEALIRVEKALALNIPGGALPCPLLKYPPPSASDIQWLDWLQKIPDDFGARIVFMAMYAREYLAKQEQDVRDSLSGKNAPMQEPFTSLCPPDVAQSRRNQSVAASCSLPESLSPAQIQDLITKRLQTLVSTKSKVLSAKQIDPTVDIDPIVEQAIVSKKYLESVKQNVESGSLPIPSTFN
jgi:hypothetical protein